MDSDSPVIARIAEWTHSFSIASPLFCAIVSMRWTSEFLRDWLSTEHETNHGATATRFTFPGEQKSHYPRPTGYGRPS